MLKTLSTANGAFFVTVAAILINAYGLGAQTTDADLAKKLIGKWEGVTATQYNPFRSLIIKSVAREGDQLVATGNYGTTGKKLPQVKINIIANGSNVVLELTSRSGDDIDLKLIGDNELTGHTEVARLRQRIHADMTLKKVQ
jgi:hypothetical protein